MKFLRGFVLSVMLLVTSIACAAGPIGTIGNLPILTVCGASFPNYMQDSTLIILVGYTNAQHWTSFKLLANAPGGADYQVPAGKTLYIWAVDQNSTAANQIFSFGWGTSGVGYDSSSAPAGQVYPFGTLAGGNLFFQNVGDGRSCSTFIAQVPQNMYPFINDGASNSQIRLYGYLK